MWSYLRCDEELGAVGVGASVGHGEQPGHVVVHHEPVTCHELYVTCHVVSRVTCCHELLVLELVAVDGVAAVTVTPLEVTALDHEVGDDPMDLQIFLWTY